MARTFIGVDICKDRLDIHHPGRGDLRLANSAPAIRRWLRGLGPGAILVFEATSRHDRALRAAAGAAGRPFARINPLHGWHFAQSLNLAKTDRVDARMLARLGAERQLAPSLEPAPERAELAELNRRRDQLIRMRTQEKNRLDEASLPLLRRDIQAALRTLSARIARIEAAIAAHLRAHPQLRRQAELLRSIPGIGPATAVALLAHLPQLGRLDRRAIASLGGLAPRAHDTGKFRGKRRIGPGRRHVRQALYMAALSALRHPQLFGGMAQRLLDRGKAGKVVAIALARKILTIANAVLRSETPFDPTRNHG